MAIFYPPIVPDALPAFAWYKGIDANDPNTWFNKIKLNYEHPIGVTKNDYDTMRVKIIKQEDNQTVIRIKVDYDDNSTGKIDKDSGFIDYMSLKDRKVNGFTIYKSSESLALDKNAQCVRIPIYKRQLNSPLRTVQTTSGSLAVGKIYKIQLAFYDSTTGVQSEWSKPVLIKRVELKGLRTSGSILIDSHSSGGINAYTLKASLQFHPSANEYIEKYRFTLRNIKNGIAGEILEQTDWLQNNQSISNTVFYHTFQYKTKHQHSYWVDFEIITQNGFELKTSKQIIFYSPVNRAVWPYRLWTEENSEDGYISLWAEYRGNSQENQKDILMISRADENSNYLKWEDLGRKGFYRTYGSKQELFRDYTVESGVHYNYGIQLIYDQTDSNNKLVTTYRTGRLTVDSNAVNYEDPITNKKISLGQGYYPMINLEYAYLSRGDTCLKIKYNNKMSSFKRNIQFNKQDSLGGKYPIISRNGNSCYAEFPVGGLITFHMNNDGDFLTYKDESGYYFEKKLIIPEEKFGNADFNTDLTPENFYIERKFREAVEKFLNSGDCLLYRSASEGNIVVSLSNISLTPNQQLGRMISEFNATAYEVGEADYATLKELGVAPTKSLTNPSMSITASNNSTYSLRRDASLQYEAIYYDEEGNIESYEEAAGQFKAEADISLISQILDFNPNLIGIKKLMVMPLESNIEEEEVIVLTKFNGDTKEQEILITALYNIPMEITPDNETGLWPDWRINVNDITIRYEGVAKAPIQDSNIQNFIPTLDYNPKIGNIAIYPSKGDIIDIVGLIKSKYPEFYDFLSLSFETSLTDFTYKINNRENDFSVLNEAIIFYNIPLTEEEEVISSLQFDFTNENFENLHNNSIVFYFTYVSKILQDPQQEETTEEDLIIEDDPAEEGVEL